MQLMHPVYHDLASLAHRHVLSTLARGPEGERIREMQYADYEDHTVGS